MKVHLSNAAYGVLDYAAYPIGMLLVAPVMLRNLGVEQYGVWAVATAAASAGSIIASGFGDANIQHVATQRSIGDPNALLRVVRSTMGIHLIMGAAIGLAAWMLAPYVAGHVASSDAALRSVCLWSLRIAGLLMLVRAIESVCISTQRAFECYGDAVRISILARLLTLVAAAALAYAGRGVVGIMIATAVLVVLGLWMQMARLKQLLHTDSLAPAFDRGATKVLFGFGIFTWLQAVSGVIFSQTDRLITGVSLGATAVASYALCVQMAQPIYGLAASGLHFLFPYLSGRRMTASPAALRKAVFLAFAANLLLISAGTAVVLLFGIPVLHAWGGNAFAQSAKPVLPFIVWSSALLGLSVTGSYAMLALGRVRTVTWFNLGGGATMLLLIRWLLPHYGVYGIAMARLSYGSITLLLYIPLALLLRPRADSRVRSGQPLRSASMHGQERAQHEYPGRGLVGPAFPSYADPVHQTGNARSMESAGETRPCANVLGVQVEALDMERAVALVGDTLGERQKGYVCIIGVHGIMEAQRDPNLAAIYASSMITVPDGMPTVWVGHWQGCRGMERVTGPDLMLEIFRRKEFSGYTHFLYGGREGVAEELSASFRRRFPWTRIVGAYTPPYRDLSPMEEEDLIATVRDLKPDIIWVGISTPRQEQFMRHYLPMLDTKLMFGVGAAFDFHTGRIKDCAEWIKRAGLQWLHRLLQDPRHLWRRYLRNNPAFLWHITLQVTGLRKYPIARTAQVIGRTPNRVGAKSQILHETGSDL